MVQGCLSYPPPPYTILFKKSNELNQSYSRWSDFLSLTFLVILISCFFLYSDNMPYIPGVMLLLPCLSTAGIIYFSVSSSFVKRVLSNAFIVKIGLLSYSLYLWHWVIITSFHYILGDKAQHIFMIIIQMTLILLLSILGYLFIEKPIRYSQISFKKSFLFIYLIPSLLLIASNYCIRNSLRNWEKTFNADIIQQSNKKLESKIIVIGDSHSWHLKDFLNYIGDKEHWRASIFKYIEKKNPSCEITFEVDEQGHNCVYEEVKDYPIVFISFFYDLYSGDYPVPRSNPKDFIVKDFYTKFERFIRDLSKDKQVYIFSNIPALSYSPLRYFRVKYLGLSNYLPPIIHMGNIQESNQKIFSIIKDIPNVHWVDIVPYLPQYYYTEDKVVYADQDHLTGFGSYQIGVNFHQHQQLLPSKLVDSLYKNKN